MEVLSSTSIAFRPLRPLPLAGEIYWRAASGLDCRAADAPRNDGFTVIPSLRARPGCGASIHAGRLFRFFEGGGDVDLHLVRDEREDRGNAIVAALERAGGGKADGALAHHDTGADEAGL